MKITIEVKEENVESAFISAIEGGSNYWYMIEREEVPGNATDRLYPSTYPFNGGTLYISDQNADDPTIKPEDAVRVGIAEIVLGLQRMATEAPESLAEIIRGDSDQLSGDALLQCIVFGEIIYS